jgi:hypothetical protein
MNRIVIDLFLDDVGLYILYRPRPYHHIGSPGHFDLTVDQDSGDQFLRVAVDRV